MNSRFNRAELISAVSIKCGISRQEADSILSSMLRNISNTLNVGDNVKLKSFGEFRKRNFVSEGESVHQIDFKPARKLDSKINKIYDYLLPAKKVFDKNRLDNIYSKFGIKDFTTADFPADKSVSNSNIDSNIPDEISGEPEKRLISDKLIDLHNEIVKSSKNTGKKNLWG